jgi:hypothetical protein
MGDEVGSGAVGSSFVCAQNTYYQAIEVGNGDGAVSVRPVVEDFFFSFIAIEEGVSSLPVKDIGDLFRVGWSLLGFHVVCHVLDLCIN